MNGVGRSWGEAVHVKNKGERLGMGTGVSMRNWGTKSLPVQGVSRAVIAH